MSPLAQVDMTVVLPSAERALQRRNPSSTTVLPALLGVCWTGERSEGWQGGAIRAVPVVGGKKLRYIRRSNPHVSELLSERAVCVKR